MGWSRQQVLQVVLTKIVMKFLFGKLTLLNITVPSASKFLFDISNSVSYTEKSDYKIKHWLKGHPLVLQDPFFAAEEIENYKERVKILNNIYNSAK